MSSVCDKNRKIIITLGSNVDEYRNISDAKTLLDEFFHNLRYTSFIRTKPIGIATSWFLNGMAYGKTTYDADKTIAILKAIELRCGSLKEDKLKGIVRLDLDLMKYGDTIYHKEDWNRTYIQQLFEELNLKEK